MNEKAPPQANEAQAQVKAEKVRLARAFAEVFGSPRKRSESQKLVLEHLSKDAGEESNAFQFQSAGQCDGIGLALAAAHRDGAQSRIRIINRQVRMSEEEVISKEKPKIKTTR